MISRDLHLAFMLSGKPIGWRCSICQRVFVPLGLEMTESEQQHLQREFRQHLCWPVTDVVTVTEITDYDKRTVPLVPPDTKI